MMRRRGELVASRPRSSIAAWTFSDSVSRHGRIRVAAGQVLYWSMHVSRSWIVVIDSLQSEEPLVLFRRLRLSLEFLIGRERFLDGDCCAKLQQSFLLQAASLQEAWMDVSD